jgi:hypothetical protein
MKRSDFNKLIPLDRDGKKFDIDFKTERRPFENIIVVSRKRTKHLLAEMIYGSTILEMLDAAYIQGLTDAAITLERKENVQSMLP